MEIVQDLLDEYRALESRSLRKVYCLEQERPQLCIEFVGEFPSAGIFVIVYDSGYIQTGRANEIPNASLASLAEVGIKFRRGDGLTWVGVEFGIAP